jgi:hypothetical protein
MAERDRQSNTQIGENIRPNVRITAQTAVYGRKHTGQMVHPGFFWLVSSVSFPLLIVAEPFWNPFSPQFLQIRSIETVHYIGKDFSIRS